MSIVAWQTRSQVRSDFFSRLLSRVARFVLVRHEKTREYIPKCPKIYQNGPKIYQNCRKIYQKGPKIYQMTMKCNDIFHSKTLQNIPKLERNYSIWQPGFCPTRSSFDSSRLIRAHSHPSNLLELILIVFWWVSKISAEKHMAITWRVCCSCAWLDLAWLGLRARRFECDQIGRNFDVWAHFSAFGRIYSETYRPNDSGAIFSIKYRPKITFK
jgi:hypothetical protein